MAGTSVASAASGPDGVDVAPAVVACGAAGWLAPAVASAVL
jgi:hypothetical protein